MKKVVWALIVVAVISFIIWSKNPLDETVNFIIGGQVPGTKIEIGFWGSLLFGSSMLWLIKRTVQDLRIQMLSRTAKEITSEKALHEFKEAHDGLDFKGKNRAVIAAPRQFTSL